MKYVPNILTVIRMLMIPVFIMVYPSNHLLAAGVFLVACLTDLVDGYLARKYDATSKFGTLCDPLADKLLQISAVICLWGSRILPSWVLIIMAAKEFLMVVGAIFLFSKQVVIPANKVGKLGSFVIFLVILYLLMMPSINVSTIILASLIGLVSFVSLVNYGQIFIDILHKEETCCSANPTEEKKDIEKV